MVAAEKAASQRVEESKSQAKSEGERLVAAAKAAIEQMKLAGITVPPGLQKIADEGKNVASTFDLMKGGVSKAAAAFGIACLTLAMITSPTPAVVLSERPITRMHWMLRAPVLSATLRRV